MIWKFRKQKIKINNLANFKISQKLKKMLFNKKKINLRQHKSNNSNN